MTNNHIVSFIGFAPADNPQIVVYVAVDNPKGTVQFGGVVAAPIVGTIIKDSLRQLGVKPRTKQMEKKETWLDEKFVTVPDVLGLTKQELAEQLVNLKLDVNGDGKVVVQQSPKAGVKVKEGSTVRILLGDEAAADE